MFILYDVVTATVASLMVGNEFAVAAFVHPQIQTLDAAAHSAAARRLARILGRVMPFWYAASLVLILGAAYTHRPFLSGSGALISCAAALWTGTILVTIFRLVPINNRIAAIDPEHPYAAWLEDRAHWDQLHRIRVAVLSIALILLFAGLLGGAAFPAS
jgi:uncharacterized membrane protein